MVEENVIIGEVIVFFKCFGYFGFLVIDKDNNLIGIVIGCDFCFEKCLNLFIRNVMIGKDDLVIVKEGVSFDVVLDFMYEYCIEKIFVVDDVFKFIGLIIVKDF